MDAGLPPDLGVVQTASTATVGYARLLRLPELPGGPKFTRRPKRCRRAPSWINLMPCQKDGAVYAVGTSKRVRAVHLRRANAMRTTSGALSGALGVKMLKRAQVYAVAECNRRVFAIGRAPIAENRAEVPPALPRCEEAAPALRKTSSACRGWTQRIVWEEGNVRYAVGSVEGIRNRNLAEKTAYGRALAHLASAEGGEVRMRAMRSNMAQCGRTTFVQVRAELSPR